MESGLIVLTLMITAAGPPDGYVAEIESWRRQRVDGLMRPTGWLSLAGLHWLSEGDNCFGSDPELAVALPEGKAPARAGVFTLRSGSITIRVEPGLEITTTSGG